MYSSLQFSSTSILIFFPLIFFPFFYNFLTPTLQKRTGSRYHYIIMPSHLAVTFQTLTMATEEFLRRMKKLGHEKKKKFSPAVMFEI